MKPAPFAYHRVDTRDEVDELLSEHGGDATLLAGGQSLLPMLFRRQLTAARIVDLNGLRDERPTPALDDGHLGFGPLTRHLDVERSPLVAEHAPLLAAAVRKVAYPAVRSRGTLIGALAYGHPASELPAALVLLDATVAVRSRRGSRRLPVRELYAGPHATTLQADEWIDGVTIPVAPAASRFAIAEFSRRGADFAVCGVAARADDGDLALAIFGADAMPRRLPVGRVSGPQVAERVQAVVEQQLAPADGQDDGYRRHLAVRLAIRASAQVLEQERVDADRGTG